MRDPRALAALALALLGPALVAGCNARRDAARGQLRVGLVFDVGGRGDGGFNDEAAAGAARAERETGARVAYADAVDGDQSQAMRRFAQQGTDLVVAVGFLASRDATLLAREFPGTKFAVIDYALPSDSTGRAMLPTPNLSGIVFREHEGAFVVGALAGLASRSGTVGFVGGMRSPLIEKFEAGYAAGIHRTCPACRVLVRYAGSTPAAFNAPAIGHALARAEYGEGADVVFHASGATGAGVFQAARETGKRAIGVDVDQWREAPGQVLTSMVKRLDVAVADVIGRAAKGELQGGMQSYGLEENGIGWVLDAHNRALVPDSARDRVETLRAAVVAGLIEVPTIVR